jgi:phosphoglycerate dehydrogenase-like enzyme
MRLGLALANAYGHEAGIAEYIFGTMIALSRSMGRIDRKLRDGQCVNRRANLTPLRG